MTRTRSASAHQKVLDAAIELVSERGVDATSMDAIAAKSGVSKATIYKHWADKHALLLEMMAEVHGLHTRPLFDSGDTRADMVAVLSYRPPENTEIRERIMPHFMAYSATNTSFGLAWRNAVMEPPRQELKNLMKVGIKRGELPRGLDFDLTLALLLGPIIYWKVFLSKTAEDPLSLAEGVVDAFWRAFGLKKRFQANLHEVGAALESAGSRQPERKSPQSHRD
ncbi:MAG: transcriptional regulator, TetR family [Bryobacterales bacterium]|nr:transcriptional regulator, TetR family [Bryobacterales bacterium]